MARGTSQCRAPPPGPPPPRTKRTNLRRTGRWTSRLARAVLAFVSGFPPGTVSRGGRGWWCSFLVRSSAAAHPAGAQGLSRWSPPQRRRSEGGTTLTTPSTGEGSAAEERTLPKAPQPGPPRALTLNRQAGSPLCNGGSLNSGTLALPERHMQPGSPTSRRPHERTKGVRFQPQPGGQIWTAVDTSDAGVVVVGDGLCEYGGQPTAGGECADRGGVDLCADRDRPPGLSSAQTAAPNAARVQRPE